ncbi:hypothetical protein H2200_011615 [Cladophialophora chaetospira]|uniref:SP-RING-type domain-containing protein n=1 Tax=Cladophialophora chaetospira TaxID=386627 RepID=A0AA38WZN0_9EURO|nr:hypothetical protein H2200_011615 [Cladophialophora chaetospira]
MPTLNADKGADRAFYEALDAHAVHSSNATSKLFLGSARKSWMGNGTPMGANSSSMQTQPARRNSNSTSKRPKPQRLLTSLPAQLLDDDSTIEVVSRPSSSRASPVRSAAQVGPTNTITESRSGESTAETGGDARQQNTVQYRVDISRVSDSSSLARPPQNASQRESSQLPQNQTTSPQTSTDEAQPVTVHATIDATQQSPSIEQSGNVDLDGMGVLRNMNGTATSERMSTRAAMEGAHRAEPVDVPNTPTHAHTGANAAVEGTIPGDIQPLARVDTDNLPVPQPVASTAAQELPPSATTSGLINTSPAEVDSTIQQTASERHLATPTNPTIQHHRVSVNATPPADPDNLDGSKKRSADASLLDERRIRARLSADVPDLPNQLPTPQDSPQHINIATLSEQFESRLIVVLSRPRTADQQPVIDNHRVDMMRDACRRNDRFYLLAHAVYCLWSAAQWGILTQLQLTQAHILGAQALSSILGSNRHLTMEVFQMFLGFPNPPERLVADNSPEFKILMEEVRCFLFHLGTGFASLREASLKRKCPPCPAEFKFSLKLPSAVLQKALFLSTLRLTDNDPTWLSLAVSLFEKEMVDPAGSAISIAELNAYHGAQLAQIVARWALMYGEHLKHYQGRRVSGSQPPQGPRIQHFNRRLPGTPTVPSNVHGYLQPAHSNPPVQLQIPIGPRQSLSSPGLQQIVYSQSPVSLHSPSLPQQSDQPQLQQTRSTTPHLLANAAPTTLSTGYSGTAQISPSHPPPQISASLDSRQRASVSSGGASIVNSRGFHPPLTHPSPHPPTQPGPNTQKQSNPSPSGPGAPQPAHSTLPSQAMPNPHPVQNSNAPFGGVQVTSRRPPQLGSFSSESQPQSPSHAQPLPFQSAQAAPTNPQVASMGRARAAPTTSSRRGRPRLNWEVQAIVGERLQNGTTEFLVRWKGQNVSHAWVPEMNLRNAQSAIASFRSSAIMEPESVFPDRGLSGDLPSNTGNEFQQRVASPNSMPSALIQRQQAHKQQPASTLLERQDAGLQQAAKSRQGQQFPTNSTTQAPRTSNFQQPLFAQTLANLNTPAWVPMAQAIPHPQQRLHPPIPAIAGAPTELGHATTPTNLQLQEGIQALSNRNDVPLQMPPATVAHRSIDSHQHVRPQQHAGPFQGQPFFPADSNYVLPQIAVPDPESLALHQVELRSPEYHKILDLDGSESDVRFYQYVEDVIYMPELVTKDSGLIRWNVQIPQQILVRKTIALPPVGEFATRQRNISNGDAQFRLKSLVLTENEGGILPTLSTFTMRPVKWPKCLSVSVNEHVGVDFRRKAHYGVDLATDITEMLGDNDNEIVIGAIFTAPEADLKFLMALEVICVADHDTLLKMPNRIPAASGLAAITNTLKNQGADDDDDLIIQPFASIDLVDPFMSVIWTTPVRGKNCTHRECFDLEAFLLSRTSRVKESGVSSADKWFCPICKSDCRPPMLVLDEFLLDVRKTLEHNNQLHAKAILVKEDGTWEARLDQPSKEGDRETPDPEMPVTGKSDAAAASVAQIPVVPATPGSAPTSNRTTPHPQLDQRTIVILDDED